MNLADLVHAVLTGDLLAARQWIADANREHVRWDHFERPSELDDRELTVAAALAELLAARAGTSAPRWTATIGAHDEPLFLDRDLEQMSRTRAHAIADAPEPLRKRNLFALPDFLDVR
ncbi:MAG TPA: hypothetical protein VMU84_15570 [Thermoanaerobaculia bacterium]|nr:hypothetical protein [Thermoanaerobaculia bacterium]